MKNNNSLSKFKQVLQLSGFTDVTERSESIQLEMARGIQHFRITDYSDGTYSVEYDNGTNHPHLHMESGNENQAMDYIREILMEVA